MRETGQEAVFVREPGGTEVGERVRALLKDESLDMCPETELLLFEAARSENTRKIIIPALQAGKIVVVDRYIDSTTAYQSFGRGLERSEVDMLNAYATGEVRIDLTVFLDAPPFANTRRSAADRMELAGMRTAYIALFQAGWFVESMWSQTLVIHMIRTPKLPFLQSRAAAPVTLLTATGIVLLTAIPFTPLGRELGFLPLPAAFFAYLIPCILLYMIVATCLKKAYVHRHGELL